MKIHSKTLESLLVLFVIALIGGLAFLSVAKSSSNAVENFVTVLPEASPVSKIYKKCETHDFSSWHPAAEKDDKGNILCVYSHEHGDSVPKWVTDAGYIIGFNESAGFAANTSSLENVAKHTAMKGFSANIKGVEIFARIHLASNPLDRTARYHSYQLFAKDAEGKVSHFQGWLNTGDPVVDRIPYRDSTAGEKGVDPGTRPIVWASTRHACQVDKTWCIELWTMTTSPWGPDISWGINDATTFFVEGEKYDSDPNSWDKSGSLGVDRSISLRLFRSEEELKKRGLTYVPVGKIWATQFGEIVSGPDDFRCTQRSVKFGTEYKNICLENYVAPTLPEIKGIEVTALKQFDAIGVELPN